MKLVKRLVLENESGDTVIGKQGQNLIWVAHRDSRVILFLEEDWEKAADLQALITSGKSIIKLYDIPVNFAISNTVTFNNG